MTQESILTIKQALAILAERWPDNPPALSTIQLWASRGLFPGAFRHANAWAIPHTALDGFERPKLGRPRKETGQ